MKCEITNIKLIQVQDWNRFVSSVYNKIYSFQQQDGCRGKGIFYLAIPDDDHEDDEMFDDILEKSNTIEMGVKFKTWLNRDSQRNILDISNKISHDLFWMRNFYPSINAVANDLYSKGLIEAGEYIINIDW